MAYFPDLAPYAYNFRSYPGVVHIGWLDGLHEFRKGSVPVVLVDKIKKMAETPTELKRGFHVCELCVRPEELRIASAPARWEWTKSRVSNGEIRVSFGETTYAAPVLIAHYIETHGYLPPDEFLSAIEESA